MTPLAVLIGKLKNGVTYGILSLFVLLCVYASLNTITLFLWGDPSVYGQPRLFHPPEIMVLHSVGMISPDLARLVVALIFWGCGIFAWLGFRQLTRKSSLDHPLRQRVVNFISSHPGCHFRSMVREVGINRGTLSYHLARLTTFGIIQEARDGGLTRYYVHKVGIPDLEQKILSHRDNHLRSQILSLLERGKHTPRTELKKGLNISGPALWYHMQMLMQDGIVLAEQDADKIGRPVQYSLTMEAATIFRDNSRAFQPKFASSVT